MRRSVFRLARAFVTALMVSAVAAAPAGAATSGKSSAASGDSFGLRLLAVPGAESPDPNARIYIIDHLAPGATIHRSIEAVNTGSAPLPVVLYSAAAKITNGSFVGSAGHTPNDVSSWTSVDPGVADIPSGGLVTAVVTIAVPANAPAGEQYAVVWLEARSSPAGGIIEVNRVGIRIYLSVGPGGAPAPDFTIGTITATRTTNGHPKVSASVRNTGGLALNMSGSLELTDGTGGLDDGPFAVTLGSTLALHQTEPMTVVFNNQLPSGPWHARISLKSGLLERSAGATVTFPGAARAGTPGGGGATVKAAPTPSSDHFGLYLLFGILLLLLAASWLLWRRRAPNNGR